MSGLRGCLKRLVDSGVLNTERDPNVLREICKKEIEDSPTVKPADKFRMKLQIDRLVTVEAIQQYIFNAFLRYNGQGVFKKHYE